MNDSNTIQQLRMKIPVSISEAKMLLATGSSLEKIEKDFVDKYINDVLVNVEVNRDEAENALRKK